MEESVAALIGVGVGVVSGLATQLLSRWWARKDLRESDKQLVIKQLNELYIKGKSVTEPNYESQTTNFNYSVYTDYLSSLTPILHKLPADVETYINHLDSVYKDWEAYDTPQDLQNEMANIFFHLDRIINDYRQNSTREKKLKKLKKVLFKRRRNA